MWKVQGLDTAPAARGSARIASSSLQQVCSISTRVYCAGGGKEGPRPLPVAFLNILFRTIPQMKQPMKLFSALVQISSCGVGSLLANQKHLMKGAYTYTRTFKTHTHSHAHSRIHARSHPFEFAVGIHTRTHVHSHVQNLVHWLPWKLSINVHCFHADCIPGNARQPCANRPAGNYTVCDRACAVHSHIRCGVAVQSPIRRCPDGTAWDTAERKCLEESSSCEGGVHTHTLTHTRPHTHAHTHSIHTHSIHTHSIHTHSIHTHHTHHTPCTCIIHTRARGEHAHTCTHTQLAHAHMHTHTHHTHAPYTHPRVGVHVHTRTHTQWAHAHTNTHTHTHTHVPSEQRSTLQSGCSLNQHHPSFKTSTLPCSVHCGRVCANLSDGAFPCRGCRRHYIVCTGGQGNVSMCPPNYTWSVVDDECVPRNQSLVSCQTFECESDVTCFYCCCHVLLSLLSV